MTRRSSPLGGLSTSRFLARFWHREAHLFRAAIPGFAGVLDRKGVLALACDPDVESRLVIREGRRWILEHGPFRPRDFARLPDRDWTVLVQGLNLHLDAADSLLRRFDFAPAARLDDLMVSYAVPGGGVGPHFDSYDVFLLQGPGRRRWRIGRQEDRSLRRGMPVRILARFRPEIEHVLEPGDMLYLPPEYAHDGVALDECFTYSVGFRAPTWKELAGSFFADLSESVDLPGRYADPGLKPSRHTGRIPPAMIDATMRAVATVRWTRSDVTGFLGRHLSEPKAHVYFDPPARSPGLAKFRRLLESRGMRMHRKSQMLYSRNTVFMNGEIHRFPRGVPASLVALADTRRLAPMVTTGPMASLLREWFDAGYLGFEEAEEH